MIEVAPDYSKVLASFSSAVASHSLANGERLLKEMDDASSLIVAWTQHLSFSSKAESTRVLLAGVRSATIEAAASLSLGLARSALFSMRAEIDMALGWLFFRDHPVEWRHNQRNAGEAKLRADVLRYLKTFFPQFESRYTLLLAKDVRTRSKDDPYHVLSAHIHSLNSMTVPSLDKPSSIVSSGKVCDECVVIQREVAEYLNDIFAAVFAESWADFPEMVRQRLQARLSPAQLKKLTAN